MQDSREVNLSWAMKHVLSEVFFFFYNFNFFCNFVFDLPFNADKCSKKVDKL